MKSRIPTRRGLSLVAIATIVAAGAGCAPHSAVELDAPAQHDRSAPITLRIRNDNWYDMRVYEVTESGSIGARITTVTSLTTATVRLRRAFVASGFVRVLLRPIGARDTYVTERMLVQEPGSVVQLQIMNQLRLSHLYGVPR